MKLTVRLARTLYLFTAFTMSIVLLLAVQDNGLAQAERADHVDSHRAHDHGQISASMTSMSGSKGSCQDQTLNCARSATPAFAPDGSLWLVWSGGGAISASKSTDLGKSFESAVEIARHDSFLDTGPDARPSVVIDKDYRIAIAYAFFKDKQWNAQANITTSLDKGKSFGLVHSIVNDPASQRFPSLALTPEGKLFAIWIDKRLVALAKKQGKPAEGGSIAYAWSNNMGETFGTEQIAEPSSCECCRIAVGLSKASLPVVVYRANFNGTTRDHASQLFEAPDQPGQPRQIANDNWVTNSCPHHGPAMTISEPGTLHTAWFTQGSTRSGTFYARSVDNGQHYSTPMPLGSTDKLSGRPYLLAVDRSIWLVWKNFDGKQASIWLQRSTDDGQTWTDPKQIAESVGYTDHPLLVSHKQHVYLSWLTAAKGYQLLEIGN